MQIEMMKHQNFCTMSKQYELGRIIPYVIYAYNMNLLCTQKNAQAIHKMRCATHVFFPEFHRNGGMSCSEKKCVSSPQSGHINVIMYRPKRCAGNKWAAISDPLYWLMWPCASELVYLVNTTAIVVLCDRWLLYCYARRSVNSQEMLLFRLFSVSPSLALSFSLFEFSMITIPHLVITRGQ